MPGLRGEVLGITEQTYRAVRAELREEGGARWHEFREYKRKRVKLAALVNASGIRPYRNAWKLAAQIEALQVVICSPVSGRCCYKHETGEVEENPQEEEGTDDGNTGNDTV